MTWLDVTAEVAVIAESIWLGVITWRLRKQTASDKASGGSKPDFEEAKPVVFSALHDMGALEEQRQRLAADFPAAQRRIDLIAMSGQEEIRRAVAEKFAPPWSGQ